MVGSTFYCRKRRVSFYTTVSFWTTSPRGEIKTLYAYQYHHSQILNSSNTRYYESFDSGVISIYAWIIGVKEMSGLTREDSHFVNYASRLAEWEYLIKKEEICHRSWAERWGNMKGSPIDCLSLEEKREIVRDYDAKYWQKMRTLTDREETIQKVKPSPSRKPITSADYGLRSAPEYLLDIYVQRKGRHNIYKTFGWPDDFNRWKFWEILLLQDRPICIVFSERPKLVLLLYSMFQIKKSK